MTRYGLSRNRLSHLSMATWLLFCGWLLLGHTPLNASPPIPGPMHSPAGSFSEEVWFDAGYAQDAKQVQVKAAGNHLPEDGNLLRFVLHIDSDIRFRDVYIFMTIRDAAGNTQAEGHLRMDLYPGDNECVIQWDASGLEPARYTASFRVNYTTLDAAALYTLPFVKVSRAEMQRKLNELETLHTAIANQLDSSRDSSGVYPYFQIKLALIEEFVPLARTLVDQQVWREAYPLLNRLTHTANSINAEYVFSSLSPERLQARSDVDVSQARVEANELMLGQTPIFLLGARHALDEVETLKRLKRFGLQLAVPEIPPGRSMAGPNAPRPVQQAIQDYLRTAESLNLAVIPQLDSRIPEGWMLDRWPDLMTEGFLNHAHPVYQALFKDHLSQVLPVLGQSPQVIAASLLDEARYKFDTERIRQLFIEHIRSRYPDRMELNANWRGHLASHDEITIWGDHPDHGYQNRRAYQYDWQQFHRRFIESHVGDLLEQSRSHAPRIHYVLPQSATAFELGETRFNLDRETLSRRMPINSLATQSRPRSGVYAYDFPGASIHYALQQSFNPQSMMVDLNAEIQDTAAMDSEQAYRFVNSLVWEGAIAGLNAMAIDAKSEVWRQPETLEALAVANYDINRLAPIVGAFHNAPTDVGILFSGSSKIFDDGLQHLSSAWNAFEGSSFAGYTVRFLTESQIQEGVLDDIKILILPETPALENETFDKIHQYILDGGAICRAGTPIPYTPHGQSRTEVLPSSGKTVLVRGTNQSTEYLHAMDAAIILGALPVIARPTNAHGYPLEGVKTRLVHHEGESYLYVLNVRKDPVVSHLAGNLHSGRDLIRGRDVKFPMKLDSLDPMLIRLEQPVYELQMTAQRR